MQRMHHRTNIQQVLDQASVCTARYRKGLLSKSNVDRNKPKRAFASDQVKEKICQLIPFNFCCLLPGSPCRLDKNHSQCACPALVRPMISPPTTRQIQQQRTADLPWQEGGKSGRWTAQSRCGSRTVFPLWFNSGGGQNSTQVGCTNALVGV
jgi:hypothetical protein